MHWCSSATKDEQAQSHCVWMQMLVNRFQQVRLQRFPSVISADLQYSKQCLWFCQVHLENSIRKIYF